MSSVSARLLAFFEDVRTVPTRFLEIVQENSGYVELRLRDRVIVSVFERIVLCEGSWLTATIPQSWRRAMPIGSLSSSLEDLYQSLYFGRTPTTVAGKLLTQKMLSGPREHQKAACACIEHLLPCHIAANRLLSSSFSDAYTRFQERLTHQQIALMDCQRLPLKAFPAHLITRMDVIWQKPLEDPALSPDDLMDFVAPTTIAPNIDSARIYRAVALLRGFILCSSPAIVDTVTSHIESHVGADASVTWTHTVDLLFAVRALSTITFRCCSTWRYTDDTNEQPEVGVIQPISDIHYAVIITLNSQGLPISIRIEPQEGLFHMPDSSKCSFEELRGILSGIHYFSPAALAARLFHFPPVKKLVLESIRRQALMSVQGKEAALEPDQNYPLPRLRSLLKCCGAPADLADTPDPQLTRWLATTEPATSRVLGILIAAGQGIAGVFWEWMIDTQIFATEPGNVPAHYTTEISITVGETEALVLQTITTQYAPTEKPTQEYIWQLSTTLDSGGHPKAICSQLIRAQRGIPRVGLALSQTWERPNPAPQPPQQAHQPEHAPSACVERVDPIFGTIPKSKIHEFWGNIRIDVSDPTRDFLVVYGSRGGLQRSREAKQIKSVDAQLLWTEPSSVASHLRSIAMSLRPECTCLLRKHFEAAHGGQWHHEIVDVGIWVRNTEGPLIATRIMSSPSGAALDHFDRMLPKASGRTCWDFMVSLKEDGAPALALLRSPVDLATPLFTQDALDFRSFNQTWTQLSSHLMASAFHLPDLHEIFQADFLRSFVKLEIFQHTASGEVRQPYPSEGRDVHPLDILFSLLGIQDVRAQEQLKKSPVDWITSDEATAHPAYPFVRNFAICKAQYLVAIPISVLENIALEWPVVGTDWSHTLSRSPVTMMGDAYTIGQFITSKRISIDAHDDQQPTAAVVEWNIQYTFVRHSIVTIETRISSIQWPGLSLAHIGQMHRLLSNSWYNFENEGTTGKTVVPIINPFLPTSNDVMYADFANPDLLSGQDYSEQIQRFALLASNDSPLYPLIDHVTEILSSQRNSAATTAAALTHRIQSFLSFRRDCVILRYTIFIESAEEENPKKGGTPRYQYTSLTTFHVNIVCDLLGVCHNVQIIPHTTRREYLPECLQKYTDAIQAAINKELDATGDLEISFSSTV